MSRTIAVTASMIKTYKACPKKYELEYLEMLKPSVTPEALSVGSSYHACVEKILKQEPWESVGVIGKMAEAFERLVPWRDWNISDVEAEFEIRLGHGLRLRGKIDALLADGTPVEHKTSGVAIDEKYIDHLAWDDQVSVYLLAMSSIFRKTPITNVIYTVCQKPTIRLKQNETEEEYVTRCGEWYDDTKMRVLTVVRRPDELNEKREEFAKLAREMKTRKHFYRNPDHCMIISCPYSSICLNYDPSILVGFVKKERVNEELCNF